MKIYKEESLQSFEFWSAAKDNAEMLTNYQLNEVENILSDLYPDGIDETELNDFFRFEFDTIREWLGIEEEEEEEE